MLLSKGRSRVGENRKIAKAGEIFQELEKKGEAPAGREQAPEIISSTWKLHQLEKEYQDLVKKDSQFRRYVRWVTSSKLFNGLILLVVLANSIVVAIDDHSSGYQYAELVFFCVYLLEFVMKIYVERSLYWNSNYNRLDAILLVINIVQLLFQSLLPYINLTYLRVIRGLRALRALRSISLFRSLQVIVSAMISTIKTSAVDILSLLSLFMFIASILAYHLFGSDETNPTVFSTMDNGFLTLFIFVTADGWTAPVNVLVAQGYWYIVYFAVSFLFIGNFIFTNLFIAVICNNIQDAQEKERKTQEERRKLAKQFKKDIFARKQRDELLSLVSHQRRLQESNIQEVFRQLAGQLNHDDIVPTSHLSCNLAWLETYMLTLNYHEQAIKKSQQYHFEMANTLAELYERRHHSM